MGELLEYVVRCARMEDMPRVIPLFQAEGWNEVVEYLNFQMDYFPEGVVVAESSTGEIVSKYSIYVTYIYIYIYLCVYKYVCVYKYIYIYIYIYIYLCTFIFIYIFFPFSFYIYSEKYLL